MSITPTPIRSSQRVLLEAFPTPPSHIPSPINPPPTGPPTLPLPPVPGPSRVSVDEQLLFLSSVANRRSSKYSLASDNRDSLISISSRRASLVPSIIVPTNSSSTRDSFTSPRSSPRTSTFFPRPSLSVPSAQTGRLFPADQHNLSDIEDDESELVPSRMPSPFLDSSWRRSKHHKNESISSIDVRAVLGVRPDGSDVPVDQLTSPSSPPLPHSLRVLPIDRTPSSSSNSPPSSSPTSFEDDQPFTPSISVKDLRLERRAERTKSAGLKRELVGRTRSRSRANTSPIPHSAENLPSIAPLKMSPVLITKTITTMTLDELGPLPPDHIKQTSSTRSRSGTISSTIAFPIQNDTKPSPPPPRTPSPDIESILCTTPRPVLKKAASQSRLRAQGIIRRRFDSASNPDYKRRASEGVVREMRSATSWHGNDLPRTRTLSRSSQGISAEGEIDAESEKRNASDDDHNLKKAAGGDESDSSIDLHTPLPHLMVRDGLLSPNSRLLPTSTRRRDGRSDSVMTTGSILTKSGILKDERDTPKRRVRHRDNRLLKGGIGLTTGLGWSDSEDEDAPSPLTRRLSTLNLSRRSSASSVRTTASTISLRHPLSRSFSSGALLESELERLEDVDEETSVPSSSRPRLLSAGRLSRPPIPPTSWQNKAAAQNRNSGTRTSTSSIGSAFSVDTTLSADGIPRRPSKLCRPSSGLRDSSGSSENNYERVFFSSGRKGSSSGNDDRTSSSTASTLSTGMPPTPRDYDPSMSSPAGLGGRSYNIEKSLPPLPNGGGGGGGGGAALKRRLSRARLDTFNFPRAPRTTESAAGPSSPTSPSPVVRPLQLPRLSTRAGGAAGGGGGSDRAAVPVPSVISSSSSSGSVSVRSSVPPSSPQLESAGSAAAAQRRPRTGTGMVYRTSSGSSRIRAPMTLSSSSGSVLDRNGGGLAEAAGGGALGRMNGSRIPPV